jgi:uncharacterized protein (UPF0305 family)
MSRIINVLINETLIIDSLLIEKAKDILSNKSYEDLIKIVKYKNNMVKSLNEKYKEEMENISNSDFSESVKELQKNDIVLEYFSKRKELEYRFISQLN